jgi:thiamine pyrophosphate-dependent acetolactate synthase large subunit-like protein
VALAYKPVKPTSPSGNPRDIAEAARVLVEARRPVIHAGQGVMYAEASPSFSSSPSSCRLRS